MFLTTKGRYAVMAMLDISMHEADCPVRLSDISQRQKIDLGYLEQIFARLRKSGLIFSVKGPGGGYQLNKPRDAICIEEIVMAVGENIKMTRCDNKSTCMGNGVFCPSHNLWVSLEENIREYLRSKSLADVCSENRVEG